jgi:iron complex transport system substrate-binding protein
MIFVDDVDRRVNVPGVVKRIVSLAPSVTENLFAIGAGSLVVGDTSADDFPPPAARLPHIGNFYQPNPERIRALQPDLILVDSATAHRTDMDILQSRFSTPLYVFSSRRFSDVGRQLTTLGVITGQRDGAHRALQALDARTVAVLRRVRGLPPVTVFLQIDSKSLYAAGSGTFQDDIIRLAGGVNVIRGRTPYPLVSKERLIAANPSVYVFTVPSPVGGATPAPPPTDPAFHAIAAVKSKRVYALSADTLSRPTPRLADGLTALAKILHP